MTKKAPVNKKAAATKQPAKPLSVPITPLDPVRFPIVALGASAGGLEAFESFFKAMESDSGLAFILIAHLDPTHVSLLPELLQKHTKMPVNKIEDGTKVLPDNVYVIPPNRDLVILNGVLQLVEQSRPRGANLPIDSFFRSLAEDQGSNAVCIILSGTGSDGTTGLKSISGEIGMILVQDEDSAKYDGMPRNAIATGLADFVLPPAEMPAQLIKFTRHVSVSKLPLASRVVGKLPNELQKIYIILRQHTGHDFSLYKKNTIYRRIERRMNVHQIEDLAKYARYLKESKREIDILFKELLIGVTSFFRNPAMFETLRDDHLFELLKGKPENHTIRAWVAGCSSGEEAYSLAIILQECMSRMQRHFEVQIFATDIDKDAIDLARTGIYPETIQLDVSPERLQAYFIKEGDGSYHVRKSIREMLVFAPQDVIKDPPFTKLDILCCRNLLIYFNTELQNIILPIFHYSLKPDGVLFLGSSETIGNSSPGLFTTLDKKAKIFQRSIESVLNPTPVNFPAISFNFEKEKQNYATEITRSIEEHSALQLVETILQQSSTPPCAIIDDTSNIIYIHGRTGDYLELPEGRVSVNILEMARPELKSVLADSIRKVASHNQEVVNRDLEIELNGRPLLVDILVKPILDFKNMHGLMMVTIEESQKPPLDSSAKQIANTKKPSEVEQELQRTRESLRTTIEELETSNEELKSTNEELQSTNEELQSTNEEMETSKEELQSLNEESITVNAELQSRLDELSLTNDDMKNLLDSTDVATLFLDMKMRVRRFTPKVIDIIPLAPNDIGRSIDHFATILQDIELATYGKDVLNDLNTRETQVNTTDNRIFAVRALPYRTANNLIDGVVITFNDITDRKRAEQALDVTLALYRQLFNLSRDSVMLIDAKSGHIKEFNQEAHERLGYTRKEFDLLSIQDVEHQSTPGKVLDRIRQITKEGGGSFETDHRNKSGGTLKVKVDAKAIISDQNELLLCTWHIIPPPVQPDLQK